MTETVSRTDLEIPRMLQAASQVPSLPPCRGCGGRLVLETVDVTIPTTDGKTVINVTAPVCQNRQCKWNGGRRSKVRCVTCGAAQPTFNQQRRGFFCQRDY